MSTYVDTYPEGVIQCMGEGGGGGGGSSAAEQTSDSFIIQ